jgi:hypothetical protein
MERTGSAYFVERPRRLEELTVPHPFEKERPYRVVKEIVLSAIDYENFITDMIADRQFIEDYSSLCKTGKVWGCLFVRRRGRTGGVLVMPEEVCYVGWAAYRP